MRQKLSRRKSLPKKNYPTEMLTWISLKPQPNLQKLLQESNYTKAPQKQVRYSLFSLLVNLHTIILAAGKGTRMHTNLPKVMQPLAEDP